MSEELIQCPFCHEKDFDLLGLKYHLELGWCEIYTKLVLDKERSHG